QRFGGVFGIAVGTAVFGARGGLGTPASFTNGFRPALAVAAALAVCGALAAPALPRPARAAAPAGLLLRGPRWRALSPSRGWSAPATPWPSTRRRSGRSSCPSWATATRSSPSSPWEGRRSGSPEQPPTWAG